MTESLLKYLSAFKKLRVDRSHGVAPHKPILLLSVLQTFQNGMNSSNRIYITPELVALFKTNWTQLVRTNHDCRISYPFFYLKSDKFWNLVPKQGFNSIETLGSQVKSFSNLNAAVDYAMISEDLFDLMIDSHHNIILQHFLLDEYFPKTKYNYDNSSQGQVKLFLDIENKILNEAPADYRQEIVKLIEQKNDEEIFLRGSLFKREIPKIYDNTCCISGMRIDTTLSLSMLDACHIVPFSTSYDDTVTNGIALCPNLHRAFDRGLISISENYRVVVSSAFSEVDTAYSVRVFENKKIKLPHVKSHYPKEEHFDWHRQNVFRK
jgi:putative restriction endonuclease